MFSIQNKIILFIGFYFFVLTNTYASLSHMDWQIGNVYCSLSSNQDNFLLTHIGYANSILAENSTNVTIQPPSGMSPVTYQTSLPVVVYLQGPNDNSGYFSSLSSITTDNIVIVEEIMVYNSGTGMYENVAGATVSYTGCETGCPDLSFISTDIGNGNPPAQPVLLHELIHRSGHVYPRVSDPGGHTEDGYVMRAGPRDQDRGLTSTQITNIRNHIQNNSYYP